MSKSVTAIDHYKISENEGIQFMIIPKGTLLYNAVHVPETAASNDEAASYKRIFQKWMGIFPFKYTIRVEGDEMKIDFCLDQMNQKFFYSNPAGGPTLLKINQNVFNHISVYETVRDMKLAVLMSPSDQHRLATSHPEKVTCDQISEDACKCSAADGKCPHAYHFDPCLKPDFLERNGCDGHFTIRSVKDGYAFRMKAFEKYFNNFRVGGSQQDSFIRHHHRLLFECGRSKDIRPASPPEFPKETVYLGFPEIVIHIFGTNWYNRHDQLNKTFSVKLPANSSAEDRIAAFSHLLQSQSIEFADNIKSPMKLIGYANGDGYCNVLTKGTSELPEQYRKQGLTYRLYLNLLNAYYKRHLQYYIDTRTGFLINDKVPSFMIKDDDGKKTSFRETCIYYGSTKDNNFVRSASSRKSRINKFWPLHSNSRLIDAFDVSASGASRTRKNGSPRTKTRKNK